MGQPRSGNAERLHNEFIVVEEATRGSEISQYPLEEKAIAISSVATSERETV